MTDAERRRYLREYRAARKAGCDRGKAVLAADFDLFMQIKRRRRCHPLRERWDERHPETESRYATS